MRAYSLIRKDPFYRHEAFLKGLAAAGYEVHDRAPDRARPGDVLVIWNRYSSVEQIADRFEAEGGTVLVAENGFLSRGGGTPKFDVHEGVRPDSYYSLAIGGYNGSGRWVIGGRERFDALEIDLKPWHAPGGHLLICPNRGFGSRVMCPPQHWGARKAEQWRSYAGEVRVREHPGNNRPGRQLHEDLVGCSAISIWASSAGVHALVAGVPVYCDAQKWVCKSATVEQVGCLPHENEAAWNKARLDAMVGLSWHQWTVSEVMSGEPFHHMLRRKTEKEVATSP